MMKMHTKIQKWGNGLAIRISGPMRFVPHFEENTPIDVEITERGLLITRSNNQGILPYSEQELLQGLTPETAHADLLATPLDDEWDTSD